MKEPAVIGIDIFHKLKGSKEPDDSGEYDQEDKDQGLSDASEELVSALGLKKEDVDLVGVKAALKSYVVQCMAADEDAEEEKEEQ